MNGARGALLLTLLATHAACGGAGRGTIGAMLARRHDDRVVVREVPTGLAAARAGLRPDDEILLVEGRDARALPDAELHRLLSGEVEEAVHLTVVRGDEVFRVTLARTPPPRTRAAPATGTAAPPPSTATPPASTATPTGTPTPP